MKEETFTCDACGKHASLGDEISIPERWSWLQDSEPGPTQHACSKMCLAALHRQRANHFDPIKVKT